jgi:hypothetical protein
MTQGMAEADVAAQRAARGVSTSSVVERLVEIAE